MAKEYLFQKLLPFLATGTGLYWIFSGLYWIFYGLSEYKNEKISIALIISWVIIVILLITGIARGWF